MSRMRLKIQIQVFGSAKFKRGQCTGMPERDLDLRKQNPDSVTELQCKQV